jgi:hypothetical protein
MLSVIMLNVIMLNVIMQNVVAPEKPALDKHSSLLQTNTLAYLAPLLVTKKKSCITSTTGGS